MKTILLGVVLLCECAAFGKGAAFGKEGAFGKEAAPSAFHRDPAPPASTVSKDLFWIADTRKMDRLLAQMNLATMEEDAYAGEVLPDSRVVWREYARQAWDFARQGDDAGVNERIGQMLKLAALYRQFGGLQNVAQGEEIRALASQTVQQLGYGGRISSPYLEATAEDSVALIERQAGAEKGEVRPIFWDHMLATARASFARLTGQPIHALADVSHGH